MKALTLWQPWASLLAYGYKQYETRSWATSYRGEIAIHAAANEPKMLFYQMEATVYLLLGKDILIPYPRGVVIATANLVDCHRMRPYIEEAAESCIWVDGDWKPVAGIESAFGDWTPGRFAWEFSDMRLLPEPVPARGWQGIWNWNPHYFDL